MKLKKNILSNSFSQLYVTMLGVLIVPLYIKVMGAEAYGLVAFFSMLNAWFNLLDLGISPALSREASRLRGGALNVLDHLRLIRTLQSIFLVIAVIGGGIIFGCAEFIATDWLKIMHLQLNIVISCIELISILIAFRWISGLYRAYITGSEMLVWLGSWNCFIASLRFLGVLPIIVYFDNSPLIFFQYQLVVAVIELIGLVLKTKILMPETPVGLSIGWNLRSLLTSTSTVLKFSMGIAFTSAIWVLVTQLDKLLLSKLLPLSEYGYFSLAVLAASGVMMATGPMTSAALPRIAYLQAINDDKGAIALYRSITQLTAVIAIPASLMLGFFSYEILLIWTGDSLVAKNASGVMMLYAFGNGFLVIGSLPVLLQYANGNVRLHVIGNIGYVLILIPALIYGTTRFGIIGAGWAWLLANMVSFIVWAAIVHREFMPRLHIKWITHDVGITGLLALIGVVFLQNCIDWPQERIHSLIYLGVSSVLLLGFSSLGSSFLRNKLISTIKAI